MGQKKATKTRQHNVFWPRAGQKKPPRLGNTICYSQELARKSHQHFAVRFVTANSKSHHDSAVRFVTAKRGPEKATEIRQYDLLRPRVGQKKPARLGSTICYGQELARKSHQDSAVRFVTTTATETRQCDLLRSNVGQKSPPRLGNTICYGQTWARKSHQDSAVRFVTAKSWPERAAKTRQYDLLRPRVGQKKGQRDSAVRFVTAKSWPERATKTRQCDLLRPNVGQKEPPKFCSTICYGQESAKRGPERATKIRQYDEI